MQRKKPACRKRLLQKSMVSEVSSLAFKKQKGPKKIRDQSSKVARKKTKGQVSVRNIKKQAKQNSTSRSWYMDQKNSNTTPMT